MTQQRWTIYHLEAMPDEPGKRYEIIDGELHVTTQPSIEHQIVCGHAVRHLGNWSEESGAGVVVLAPGVIFAVDDAVAPDVVWVSRERFPGITGEDHKFHAAPDLVVEVLSPGAENERRDREIKLLRYSLYGVREYWIINWRAREVTVYRREGTGLQLVATLGETDQLESPLLPGFGRPVSSLFTDLPAS